MEYGFYTHQGNVRKCNEDFCFIPDNSADVPIIIVADGMGGHNAGDLASRMAVEGIVSYFRSNWNTIGTNDEVKDAVYLSLQKANKEIYQLSVTDEQLSGMGTTLTLGVFFQGRIHIGHVGDTRCYIIHNRESRQITKDHSLVQELLDNGSITEEEVANHPQKNVITRALGTEESIRIDYYEEVLEEGDIILMCSDGLLHYVDINRTIPSIEAGIGQNELAAVLGNSALDGGGIDNISVVTARYSGTEEER